MSKNKSIRLAIGILLIALIFVSGVLSATYLGVSSKDKKAMIILPGLFGSALYDTETGDYVWDNFEGLENVSFAMLMNQDGISMEGIVQLALNSIVMNEVKKILENDGAGSEKSLLNMMGMNTDGTSSIPTVERVPWSDTNRWRFGVINAHKEMWETLNERYGDTHEVQVFNYDFRKDIRYNAMQLERYINKQGYTDVVLLAHSNGGPVASAYLARRKANRDKVSKFIAYNAPFLGSFSAIGIIEDPMGMISGVKEALEGGPLGSLANTIENIFDSQFLKLINMWPVYQLLPTLEMLQEYEGEQAGYFLDGKRLNFKTNEELWEFYCSRPWAKNQINGKEELKVPMQEWLDYVDSMYVEQKDGTKVHASTLVDTTYINGNGKNGGHQVYYSTNPDTGKIEKEPFNGITTRGDGTVTTVSATIGYAVPEAIKYFEGYDHYALLYDFNNVAADITFEVMDASIVKNVKEIKAIDVVAVVSVALTASTLLALCFFALRKRRF